MDLEKNYQNAAIGQMSGKKLAERSQPYPPMTAGECAGRQSSKALLLEHAERLRKEAHNLESLAYAVEHVRGDAESTLYRILSGDIYKR